MNACLSGWVLILCLFVFSTLPPVASHSQLRPSHAKASRKSHSDDPLKSVAHLPPLGPGLVASVLNPANLTKSDVSYSDVTNSRDIQFALNVLVGGQALHVAPDTGSFAFALSSTRCKASRCPLRAFHASESASYKALNRSRSTVYGDGNLSMQEAGDDIMFAGLGHRQQVFWEITNVDKSMFELWSQAAYDGILGLPWHRDPDVAGGAQDPTILEAFGIQAFTVCFGRSGSWKSVVPSGKTHEVTPSAGADGTPSRIFWSSKGSLNTGSMKYFDVLGSGRWAVKVGGVSLHHRTQPERNDLVLWNTPSVAIVDTGTSTLQAPAEHFRTFLQSIGHIDIGCSNFDQLPDLHFRFGGAENGKDGIDIVLPPRAYVKRFRTSIYPKHNKGNQGESAESDEEMCLLRIASNTVVSGDVPVWIFGVPFLQEYVVEFDRSQTPAQVGVAAHPGVCPHGSVGGHLGALSLDSSVESRSRIANSGGDSLADSIPDTRTLSGFPSHTQGL